MRIILLTVLALYFANVVHAQDHFPVNGVKDTRLNAYAFTNATIYVDDQTKYEQATLLIKDGKVISVSQNGTVPSGYTTVDTTGKTIYPSFIDLVTNYGLPKKKGQGGFSWGRREIIEPEVKGPYNANDAIKSYYKASEEFNVNGKAAKAYRSQGFGTVLTHRYDGIARGTSALVALRDNKDNEAVLKANAAAHYSFSKGSSKMSFPISMMGYVALLRQTYMDASWYAQGQNFTDLSLEAWNQNQALPQIFYTNDKFSVIRADKIGDEFGKQYIIKSGGDAYQRIDEVKATGAAIIAPVNFPKALDVEDSYATLDVTLDQMKHWEMAPTNPAALAKAGIQFSLTTDGLKMKNQFLANVKKAVENGLTEQAALKALTTTPARLINASSQVGSLKNGRLANFIITDGNIFGKESKILENWIQGERYEINKEKVEAKDGQYVFNVGDSTYQVTIEKNAFNIVINDSTKVKLKSTLKEDAISISYKPQGNKAFVRLSGWNVANGYKGTGQNVDGAWLDWQMTFQSDLEKEEKKTEEKPEGEGNGQGKKPEGKKPEKAAMGEVTYPFVAFGSTSLPTRQNMLIKGATVWTNEEQGILQNADVLVVNGKIQAVGQNLDAGDAVVVDGTGKHLTPGIIDEHSHIALSGTNDVATNSGMVRMADVIDPEDIAIYRQLAGGVTASQLLHGSANPVGGQSAIIKLKWGESADNMLINDADPFIKFALGENVKRSSSSNSIRYPQTRMGVEQVYVDAFTNALAYQKEWQAYNSLSSKTKRTSKKPRRDLVHETMLEIINKERFITCHSYVQSEINMLMKVAEQFNFNINTFTHILEGYKVADKMAAHGAGASTFSDWWAYKWEVRYAIPYNATLMHNEGVVTAINSDDGEMARRLNQEAAKSIKYGGMSEEDALKMVTLNPAKLLHLDDKVGSIKIGKDADLVLWTDHPLSIYAQPEKTMIEGVVYFDMERDEQLRKEVEEERNRLVQKMKAAPKNGGGAKSWGKKKWNFHCDDIVIHN